MRNSRALGLGLLLVAATFVAYGPVWHAGFVWDDNLMLTENACINGPLGFKEIWTSGEANYYPLTLTVLWVLHKFWGLAPLPYHLLNVTLHAACAVLLWRVLRALRIPAAWPAAALWALHPLQVESVAWVTEIKNIQSCLFYLCTILCFVRWNALRESQPPPAGSGAGYAWTLVCALAALLSKSSTVMLPVVLALCAWWRDGRWRRRRALELAPFFLLSFVMGLWTIWEQKHHSLAIGDEWVQTWPQRIAISGRMIWFYLGKLFWPHPLMFIYPRWQLSAPTLASFIPALAAVAALLILWWYRDSLGPGSFFACAYFLLLIFPVLDFFDVYFFRYSFVGDHFQYLAGMGPVAWTCAMLDRALSGKALARRAAGVAFGAVAIVFCALTWQQARTFHDFESLWRDTLAKNPQAFIAHDNLGIRRLAEGDLDHAQSHFEASIRIQPHPESLTNLGIVRDRQGRFEEAIALYEHALRLNPRFRNARLNLAICLAGHDRAEESLAHFREVLRIAPDWTNARFNLGVALASMGRLDEAATELAQAARGQPHDPDIRLALGSVLERLGRYEDAQREYRAAGATGR